MRPKTQAYTDGVLYLLGNVNMTEFGVFTLFLFGLAAVILFLGVKSVPQGNEWTVERFGGEPGG